MQILIRFVSFVDYIQKDDDGIRYVFICVDQLG